MKQIEKLLIEEFKKNNINYDTKPMYDYVDDSFTDVLKSVIGVVEKLAIPAVVGQSEQLVCPDCKQPFTKEELQVKEHCFNCGWGFTTLIL